MRVLFLLLLFDFVEQYPVVANQANYNDWLIPVTVSVAGFVGKKK